MTPARLESLRADFEAACLSVPAHERPSFQRIESGEYRTVWARAMFRGWSLAWAHYCDGEASGPSDPPEFRDDKRTEGWVAVHEAGDSEAAGPGDLSP